MYELKNRTSPDENSVAADLARKANAKATKVKEEEIESHAGECLVGSVGAMEVRGPCVGGAMEVHVRVWWSLGGKNHGGKGWVEPWR